MTQPFTSFSVALFIWFLTIFFIAQNFLKPVKSMPVSLEIEASEINSEAHQEHISAIKKSATKIAKHDLANTQNQQNSSNKKVEAIYNPLPAIPDDLRDEAFNSKAVVKFYINDKGLVERLDLIKPCANPRLNSLLLKTLKTWKFSSNGQAETKEIEVNFEVR